MALSQLRRVSAEQAGDLPEVRRWALTLR